VCCRPYASNTTHSNVRCAAIPNLRSSAGVCFALATRTVVRGAQFSPPDGFPRRAALATVSESLNSRVHRTESGAICRLADRQMRERDQSGILAHGTNRTSLDCYVTERSTSEGFLNSTGFRITPCPLFWWSTTTASIERVFEEY
jgi:hypothetical protein